MLYKIKLNSIKLNVFAFRTEIIFSLFTDKHNTNSKYLLYI